MAPIGGDYASPDGQAEAYLAASSGLAVAGAGCSFPAGDVFALRTAAPVGVVEIDPAGHARALAAIVGVDTLNGIAFDRVGRFGNRLLVTGPKSGRTVVQAVDCNGRVTLVTNSAPVMEGGMEVAPVTFGAYGGELIGTDELTGRIIAISAEGLDQVVATDGQPVGGDIGAESAGFVPRGFSQGGYAYLADRATPGNAHAGTDSILRLSSSTLLNAGVREGDLLVAGEGGGATVAVHCGADLRCSVVRLGQASAAAHVEGHLLLVASNPGPSPSPLPPGRLGGAGNRGPLGYLPFAAVIVVLGGLTLLYYRRRGGRR
ncbi:MAG: hypothetical protein NVS9B1_10070 [Candidatus Dormibacteraceae bacterium]